MKFANQYSEHINDLIATPLSANTLNFREPWSKAKKTFKELQERTCQSKKIKTSNCAILTGKKNNIVVIDLDCEKWLEPETHPFVKTFGMPEEYIKKVDTFAVKSISGGYHLYFKYVPKEVARKTQNETLGIDIQGDVALIFAPNTFVPEKKNKICTSPYRIYHDVSIKEMPQDMRDFCQIVYANGGKDKKSKEKQCYKNDDTDLRLKELDFTNHDKDLSNFTVSMPRDKIIELCEALPDKYFNKVEIITKEKTKILVSKFWKRFTITLKFINDHGEIPTKDIWDDFSLKRGIKTYCQERNEHFWEVYDTERFYQAIRRTFEDAGSHLGYYIKKNVPRNIIIPDECVVRQENERIDLPNENFLYNFQTNKKIKKKHLALKGDTNIGKTHTTIMYVKKPNSPPFISITPRVSLASSQFDDFDKNDISCLYYDNMTGALRKGQSLVCEVESLSNRLCLINDFSEYFVFIDEVNSVVETITTSSTCNNRRQAIFKKFFQILSTCKFCYACDADFTDTTLKFLGDDFYYAKFDRLCYKGIEAEEMNDEEKMFDLMCKTEKWLCFTDSYELANNVRMKIDKDILIIDRDFKEMITEEVLDSCDRVICSPTVTIGVNSKIRRHVFCDYRELTISPKTMVQQFCRCRNLIKLYYLFHLKAIREPKFDTLQDAHDSVADRVAQGESYEILGEELSPSIKKKYHESLAEVEYKIDCYNTNKYLHFRSLLNDKGMIDIYKAPQKTIKNAKEHKELRQQRDEYFLQNIDIEAPKYEERWKLSPSMADFVVPKDGREIYVDLYLKTTAISEHFNFVNLFYRDSDTVEQKRDDKDDFKASIATSQLEKICFLKELAYITQADQDFNPTKMPSKTMATCLENKYRTIYKLNKFKKVLVKGKVELRKKTNWLVKKDLTLDMKNQLTGLIGKKFVKHVRKEAGSGDNRVYWYEWEVINHDYHMTLLKARKPKAKWERNDEEYSRHSKKHFFDLMDETTKTDKDYSYFELDGDRYIKTTEEEEGIKEGEYSDNLYEWWGYLYKKEGEKVVIQKEDISNLNPNPGNIIQPGL